MLDSDNLPHICYYEAANTDSNHADGKLKYVRFNGSDWEIMNVDSIEGLIEINLALDSNNRPHISYCDHVNHTLKYAFMEGNSWNITKIDPDSLVGTYSSLVLDSKDCPHICYCDVTNSTYYDPSSGTQKQSYDNGVLKYARFTGTDWEVMTVDSSFRDPSLVLDSEDQPHISYITPNHDLKYAILVATSPIEPLNLQATVENGKIALNWSAPSFDGGSTVTNYNIYRGIASGNGTLLATVGNLTFFIDELVEDDKTYYYQVSAVNLAGEGAKSNEVTATLYQSIIQAYSLHIVLIIALVIVLIVTIALVRKLSVRSAK